MKLLITLLLSIVSFAANAQYEYSNSITHISGSDNNIILQVAVQAHDKKELEPMACKSIVYAYLFNGIPGVGDGEPLLDDNDSRLHAAYLRALFDTKYTVYANMPRKIDGPRKNTAGMQEATYQIKFHKSAFDKDLMAYNLIQGGETKPELPSIMVVPFRQDGQSYRQILDSKPEIRLAISKVQTAFSQAGYTTIDFIAKLEAAERHSDFTSDNADSFAAQLIRNSGSDIYVSVDCSVIKTYNNIHVGLAMKAYYSANGNITASATSSYDGNSTIDRCYIGTIHKAMPELLRQIKWPPTKIDSKLTIGVGAESMIDLDHVFEQTGTTIAEEIRSWVKKNARAFHQQGLSSTEIIFDSITMPKDCDSTDFAMKLAQYLRRKGISAKYTIDGLSIYITITD